MAKTIFNVEELSEKNLDIFLNFLNEQAENKLNVRNKYWFKNLIEDYKNKKYIQWFMVMSDDKVAAIAAIQKIQDGLIRLLTRYTLSNEYRRNIIRKRDTYLTPGFVLVLAQYEYIKDRVDEKTSFIITLQDLKRRQALNRTVQKLNLHFDKKWILGDDMILTCDDKISEDCWQNYCYLNKQPKFRDRIRIDQWQAIFQ